MLLLQTIDIVDFLTSAIGARFSSLYTKFVITFGMFLSILLVVEAFLTFYRVTIRITRYFERKAVVAG